MRDNEHLNHNDFLSFQLRRSMINFGKEFLIILEDFKKDGLLSEEYYQKLRGRILSSANDKIRDLEEIIKNLDIEIRKS